MDADGRRREDDLSDSAASSQGSRQCNLALCTKGRRVLEMVVKTSTSRVAPGMLVGLVDSWGWCGRARASQSSSSELVVLRGLVGGCLPAVQLARAPARGYRVRGVANLATLVVSRLVHLKCRCSTVVLDAMLVYERKDLSDLTTIWEEREMRIERVSLKANLSLYTVVTVHSYK